MARAFMRRDGELRGMLILGIVAGAMALMAVLGTVAMVFGGMLGGDALAWWVLATFVFVKLPVLGLVWWTLGRKREAGRVGGWATGECHEILAYLEREARTSVTLPDADKRLTYFCREAWFVADNASDADTAAAVETARRIEAMASEAGVDVARARLAASAREGAD
jgi:hypothetical protein